MSLILCFNSDELLIKDVITPGSELLQTMAVDLNREEVPGVKNWRHLACKLEVPRDVLQEFSGESTAKRSPTKEVIQWLCGRFPDTTLIELVDALEKVQRKDAIKIIKNFSDAFGECKVYLAYIGLLANSSCKDFMDATRTSSEDLYGRRLILIPEYSSSQGFFHI